MTIDLRGDGSLVLATDQREHRVVAYHDGALRWAWRPPAGRGWRLPSDVRVRWVDRFGGLVMVVADSDGYVGLIGSDGGELWAVDVERHANPHAVEVLEADAVAIAASDGGWVRIYSLSRPKAYAELRLPGAHGLQWEKGVGLWALGDDELVLVSVHDGMLEPIRRVPLPTPGGHDLTRVAGKPGRLWVSTTTRVYQYEPGADRWHNSHPCIDRQDVKSIGDHPVSGQVLMTCADDHWWTASLLFVDPDQRVEFPGARIYKARWSVAEIR